MEEKLDGIIIGILLLLVATTWGLHLLMKELHQALRDVLDAGKKKED